MNRPRLILASASPRRLELLAQIGVTPQEVQAAALDETPHRNELPLIYAARIAREKAEAIAAKHPDATVLAADTVVFTARTILPKAEDEATARKCLQRLSGRRHRVVTAVALIHAGRLREKHCSDDRAHEAPERRGNRELYRKRRMARQSRWLCDSGPCGSVHPFHQRVVFECGGFAAGCSGGDAN